MRQAGAGLCTVGVSFGAALPATVADCSGGSNRRSPRRSRFFHKSAAAKTESRSASISSEIAYYPFRTFFTLCRFGRTPPTGAELAAGLETDFSGTPYGTSKCDYCGGRDDRPDGGKRFRGHIYRRVYGYQ